MFNALFTALEFQVMPPGGGIGEIFTSIDIQAEFQVMPP